VADSPLRRAGHGRAHTGVLTVAVVRWAARRAVADVSFAADAGKPLKSPTAQAGHHHCPWCWDAEAPNPPSPPGSARG